MRGLAATRSLKSNCMFLRTLQRLLSVRPVDVRFWISLSGGQEAPAPCHLVHRSVTLHRRREEDHLWSQVIKRLKACSRCFLSLSSHCYLLFA